MPKLKNRVPSYRKHKASGQAIVVLNGKAHYLGPYDSPESRAAYDRLIAEWTANGRRLNHAPGDELTVVELMDRYLDHCSQWYRDPDGNPTSSIYGVRSALRRLRKLYERTPVVDIDPQAVKAVRQLLIDDGLCRKTVNDYMSVLTTMFRWGVENAGVPAAVLAGIQAVRPLRPHRSPAPERERVLPVPDADIEAVRPHVSRQVAAMIDLQRFTGMRPGEVCIMRGCDIDTTGRVWLYRPQRHKTQHHGRERIVYLGPKAQAIVRQFLKPDLEAYLFSPADAEAERSEARAAARRTPMTPSQRRRAVAAKRRRRRRPPSQAYTTGSYRRALQRACEAAEIPTWSVNQLRHNAATHLRKQFGMEVARVVLGHSTPRMTEVYAEVDHGVGERIMAEVG